MDDDREAYEFSYALYLARQIDREAAQMIVEAAEAGEINLNQAIEILRMYSYKLNASLPKDRDGK